MKIKLEVHSVFILVLLGCTAATNCVSSTGFRPLAEPHMVMLQLPLSSSSSSPSPVISRSLSLIISLNLFLFSI